MLNKYLYKKINYDTNYFYDIIFIIILAVLYNLSFSPFDFKFTIYLSLIGYFFLIYNKEKTLAMKYSFIYGFFIYLIGVSWIFNSLYDYGGKNYILSSLMTFIFISLLASFFILIGYIFNKNIKLRIGADIFFINLVIRPPLV